MTDGVTKEEIDSELDRLNKQRQLGTLDYLDLARFAVLSFVYIGGLVK